MCRIDYHVICHSFHGVYISVKAKNTNLFENIFDSIAE